MVEQFEEYRTMKGMTKSEAVRALMRDSLERELSDDHDDAQRDREPAQTSSDLIAGNEPIILGGAFLIGSDGILSALTAVAGVAGAALFALTGVLITSWILHDVWTNWRTSDDEQTPDRTHSGAGGAD